MYSNTYYLNGKIHNLDDDVYDWNIVSKSFNLDHKRWKKKVYNELSNNASRPGRGVRYGTMETADISLYKRILMGPDDRTTNDILFTHDGQYTSGFWLYCKEYNINYSNLN